MTNRVLLALACVLLVVRLPSLVQPMGADQGLYAYIGERIRSGGVPYRDAWDQKPPAIHVTYAVMRAVLPRDAAVPAADLLAATLIATCLWQLGRALAGPLVGPWSAVVFLFLSNPAFARLAGVSVRAQRQHAREDDRHHRTDSSAPPAHELSNYVDAAENDMIVIVRELKLDSPGALSEARLLAVYL